MLDANSSLISKEEYYRFGETSFGAYGKKRYRFCGKEKDEESGLYYYGLRYYNPWTCRFINLDPLAAKYPFYTPYQYAGNKPINFIDLDGLEPAPPKEKQSALDKVVKYASTIGTTHTYSKISKQDIVNQVYQHVVDPGKSTMPESRNLYCGMYAFAYAFSYYDPETYTKATLDLVQNGQTEINGVKISASEKLRDKKPDSNIGAELLSGAVREIYNNSSSTYSGRFWSATGSGDMKKILTQVIGLNAKEFSYGHEYLADGITSKDLITLGAHVNSGELALLRVNANQFLKTDTKGELTGDIVGGDHWGVLTGISSIDLKNNTIRVNVYDNHQGTQLEKVFNLDTFKDMISHVLMAEKKTETKTQKK